MPQCAVCRKRLAIQEEDYDTAKAIKMEIAQVRAKRRTEMDVPVQSLREGSMQSPGKAGIASEGPAIAGELDQLLSGRLMTPAFSSVGNILGHISAGPVNFAFDPTRVDPHLQSVLGGFTRFL